MVASTDSTVVIVDISQWESKKFDILAKFSQHRGVGGKVAGSMDVDGEEQEVSGGDGRVETIISMTVSADGQWLATGDVKNRIFVFNLDTVQVSIKFAIGTPIGIMSRCNDVPFTNLVLISHVICCSFFTICPILASCNSPNIRRPIDGSSLPPFLTSVGCSNSEQCVLRVQCRDTTHVGLVARIFVR